MAETINDIIGEVRDRFHHVDTCPFQGERIFFENAGGALTLKSVVETSARLAAIPDNQGRDNPASRELIRLIANGRADTMRWMNAGSGQIFVGESGTEVLFRMIRTAITASPAGGSVLGSTVEHPASRSAAIYWAEQTGRPYISVAHNAETGTVDAEAYAAVMTKDIRVATIIHTSPVTGMGMDLGAIVDAIRNVSPDCLIIVDGIQHAAHGQLDLSQTEIDGYAISPYKVFSRHGYGIGWVSDRLAALPHEKLIDGPELAWEFGTRDTAAYATLSDVVAYFEWLGSHFTAESDPRKRIEAAGRAIHAHEKTLTDAMLYGTGNLEGLSEVPGITILGGAGNPNREGLVSFAIDGCDDAGLVAALSERGIRVHIRKADHYSAGVLKPLDMASCVRVSLCHYNTLQEVAEFLTAIKAITGER